MILLSRVMVFWLLTIFSFNVSANNIAYNQINLQASASKNVAHDMLEAILIVQENGRKPALLSERVNKVMRQILTTAVQYKNIKQHTTKYNTRPIYKNGKIISWQVSQQIKLTSTHFDKLSELVAELNQFAHVQSMTFRLSDDLIEQNKQALTKTAIKKFRDKAQLIAQQFHKDDYELIHLSVDTDRHQPRPMMMGRMAVAADAASPAVVAGTNKVTINVNGTVQLID